MPEKQRVVRLSDNRVVGVFIVGSDMTNYPKEEYRIEPHTEDVLDKDKYYESADGVLTESAEKPVTMAEAGLDIKEARDALTKVDVASLGFTLKQAQFIELVLRAMGI